MVDSAAALAAYQAQRETLRIRLTLAAETIWGRFGGPSDEQAAAFVGELAPLVTQGQVLTAQTTDAYLALFLQDEPVGLVPAEHVAGAVRSGTPPPEVYQRTVVQLRGGLAKGLTYADANRAATARLTATVETDLQLAHRSSARAVFTRRGVKFYRRVTTVRSCGLCGRLTTKRYHSSELMPVHHRCDCTVAPIVSGFDPEEASLIGEDPLPPVVHHHGELGPVLAQAGHHFKGTDDL